MANLESRGRRVFVPRSVGVLSALRQVITGAIGEKVALAVSARTVPSLERELRALDGEFGANSVERRRAAG